MRRTRLSRKQLRYLEQRGLIGVVVRSDDRRVYSERQVTLLELIARLRELGMRLDEAAALAHERLGGDAILADDRLEALMVQAVGETERRARVVGDLSEIQRRRQAGLAPGR